MLGNQQHYQTVWWCRGQNARFTVDKLGLIPLSNQTKSSKTVFEVSLLGA